MRLNLTRLLLLRFLIRIGLVCWLPLSHDAMEYYINPNSGSETNAGTVDAPWKDLETVLSTGRRFQKSDTIILFSGDHGAVSINAQNGEGVAICAAPRQKPVV